ncbi:MAG TPA: 1-acyl-sn-glycerol-3-phosphate acyltransferase [Verrucomicrobiae bacterium]|nr:1-acyl-sn-glycerol-3-phosphate acyltransferase [Verrucomicrobiae bacterium]
MVYFEKITLLHREHLPRGGPVLYVGLHRNGAVDGFVYNQVLRQPVFMVSTQLRKGWFARLFFPGIAVSRTQDGGDRALNDSALRECLDHLRAGGELFVFPEGTSSLGPHHLPFKGGAARLWLAQQSDAPSPPLQVIPVGIYYECPWAFRSKVEVVIGPPLSTDSPPAADRNERLGAMKCRIESALAAVGINVASDDYQELIQRFAYASTLGTHRSYFKSLKTMEQAVPAEMLRAWSSLEPELRSAKLWLHQGLALFPVRPVVVYLAAFLVVAPLVIAAIGINLPAFLAGWYAGRKFPDDRNVVSLWKILIGVPMFAVWGGAVIVSLLLLERFWWLAAYAAVTCAGLQLYHRFKKLAVALHNVARKPTLRPRMLAFRRMVLESLPDETA